jgi:hypothetical protein
MILQYCRPLVESEMSPVASYICNLFVFQMLSLIPSLIQLTTLSTVEESDLYSDGEIDLKFKQMNVKVEWFCRTTGRT